MNQKQVAKPAAAPAVAATTTGQDNGTPPADAVIVTGSRIHGIAPVGSNVIAIDQSKIAQEPVTSVNDLLRRVPQVDALGANRQGGTAQNAAANATRGAGINLRGIGTNATLLLYDGKRFPPQGTQGQYTDPSVIPAIALARIEVVADGASAIYGSDAIAGVVNFILRKNFDGIELRGRAGFTDGLYGEQQVSGIIGKKWNGGSAMLAAEFTDNSALLGNQLPFYQDNHVSRGVRDLRTTFCNPGTISVSGSTYAIPVGGVTPATASSLVRGTSNKCFYNRLDTVIPQQKRYNVIGNVSQQIGDKVRVFGDGFWSKRNGTIAQINNVSAVVPSTNPFYVAPVGVTPPLCVASVGAPIGARCETVTWSMVPELGETYNPYRGKSWNLMGGVEVKPFGNWRATAYYAHGQSEDIADRHLGLNAANLAAALRDTNPLTALNVFGTAPNNPATLASLRDQLFIIIGRTKLDVVNVQADGSLFSLPGGDVRLAVGGEYRNEYTFTDLVTGSSTSQLHTADAGSRNVKAAFGELFVPIFGSANAVPGIRELSLSLAGRYEDYSDFGSTSNPKLGFNYRPFDDLKIRGSYGTSFRAPTFVERSTIAGGAGLYYDTLPGPNGNLTGIGIAGGNPNLKPETARTWSIGAELSPRAVPGFLATLTYWDIDYKNQIQALRGTAGLLTNPLYASFVELNPTPAEVQALINSGLPINSAINPNVVQFIAHGERQNLGTSLVSGIDFGLYYQHPFGAVKFDAGFQGTYYTKYKFEAVPDQGFSNVLGVINFPQKFRSQADVGVKWATLTTRVTWNHLAGYLNNTVTPAQHVSPYDTVDLYAGWDVTPRATIAVDVRNLFNRNPPFVDVTRGYDPQSSNPIPRLISVTAGLKF